MKFGKNVKGSRSSAVRILVPKTIRQGFESLRGLGKNNVIMELEHTQRGFAILKFKDRGNLDCSLQKSSIASEEHIWLGIDQPKLSVFEDEELGKYVITDLPKNWMVDSRMHLSQSQVKELLPFLQKFVETGEL